MTLEQRLKRWSPRYPIRLQEVADYVQRATQPVSAIEVHEQTDVPIEWVNVCFNRLADRNMILHAGGNRYRWNPLVKDVAAFRNRTRALQPGQHNNLLMFGVSDV